MSEFEPTNALDEQIAASQRRHRHWVIGGSVVLVTLVFGYLSWLFLLHGVALHITPDEAQPHAHVQKAQGRGFVLGHTAYSFGGDLTLTITAPLYYPKTIALGGRNENRRNVQLQPLPAQVQLSASSAQQSQLLAATQWFATALDSQQRTLLGEGQSLSVELPEGEYRVQAENPYFYSHEQAFVAEKGAEQSAHFALEPVRGTLQLRSEPAGATIRLNQEKIGTTPLTLAQLGGEYELELTLDGHDAIIDRLVVQEQAPIVERNYRLQTLGATLRANVQPSGGILTVNGQPISNPGRVAANQALNIRYSKAGYQSAHANATLAPNSTHQVSFQLRPEYAEVTVSSNVPAQVYQNGRNLGETPLTLTLQTLGQQLELRRPYYRSSTVTVLPEVGQRNNAHVNLVPEFDARRADNQPLFASSMGIQMIPVQLEAFTMGSPNHEAGRVRNEHQRPVQFTRDIWLSSQHITEGQYARFSGQGDRTSQLPKTNISWLDAAKFSNWLSEQEGLPPFYLIENNQLVGVNSASRGYRLPTEAEWEFVAKHFRRAARTAYVWGNQSALRDAQANFADEALRGEHPYVLTRYNDNHKGVAPVGSYPADRNGFYDLDGNVREWVHDRYSTAPAGFNSMLPEAIDYLGPASGNGHVVKGASYLTGQANLLRASVRSQAREGAVDIGFRVARYHQAGEP